jgi:hypothetical protein
MRAALFLLVLLLGACASEPAPYHSGNEIPRGPGLLTGPSGEFVLSADEWRRFQEWKAQQKQ